MISASSTNSDILFITISDDTNPLNLHIATIDLNKFLKMRREQNIFVEFSQFAEKTEALLDFCIAAGKPKDDTASCREDDDQNRFICVMNTLQ